MMIPNNLLNAVQQFRSNPMQFLLQRRLNVPQNIMGDPAAIVNHLLSTGQITQDQVNRAYQTARQFK